MKPINRNEISHTEIRGNEVPCILTLDELKLISQSLYSRIGEISRFTAIGSDKPSIPIQKEIARLKALSGDVNQLSQY